MAAISFAGVGKVYPDGTRAVESVDLEIPDQKLVVLVGPSGCGKTTLLRMAAGLEQITEGTVSIGQRVVNDVPARDRDIAMVFQNYALYPHMSVRANMGFGLKLRRVAKAQIDARVRPAAAMLGLADQLAKKPGALSGGQRQRVAMGRAMVREPQAFLMDEPLSNLDAKLRVQMRAEIGRLQKELGVTTIYVTHDQNEAMTLGDLVAVMRKGVLQQVAEPQVLFNDPANIFVAGFIGSPAMNLVEATLERVDGVWAHFGGLRLRVPDALLSKRPALERYFGRAVVLGIRPEDIREAGPENGDLEGSSIPATVELCETFGREAYLYFSVAAPPVLTEDMRELAADTDASLLDDLEHKRAVRVSRFVARVGAARNASVGETLALQVDTAELQFFDIDTGARISGGSPPAG